MGCNWPVVSALMFLAINSNDNYNRSFQCLYFRKNTGHVTLCWTQKENVNKYLFAYERIAPSGFL